MSEMPDSQWIPFKDIDKIRLDTEWYSPGFFDSCPPTETSWRGYGADCYEVMPEDLEKLRNGAVLCLSAQDEYVVYLRVAPPIVDATATPTPKGE